MRVLVTGGGERDAALIAAALRQGGLTVAEGGAPFDLMVTLGRDPRRLHAGELVIDFETRRVARAGRAIRLTPIEFDILAFLWRQRRPVGRAELLRAIWGYDFDPGTNLVAVHVSRLRAKIGAELIASVPGGYRVAFA